MGPELSATQAPLTATLNPELEQQIAPTPESSRSNRWIIRSCYGCNSNKVRCDKKEPCSACSRAGRTCTYPPSGPRKRRAKKTIIADMASRIASLESSLARARENGAFGRTAPTPEATASSPSERSTTTVHSSNQNHRCREDILVQKGSSSQYFNEVLLSRVIEEVSSTDIISQQTVANPTARYCRSETSIRS